MSVAVWTFPPIKCHVLGVVMNRSIRFLALATLAIGVIALPMVSPGSSAYAKSKTGVTVKCTALSGIFVAPLPETFTISGCSQDSSDWRLGNHQLSRARLLSTHGDHLERSPRNNDYPVRRNQILAGVRATNVPTPMTLRTSGRVVTAGAAQQVGALG